MKAKESVLELNIGKHSMLKYFLIVLFSESPCTVQKIKKDALENSSYMYVHCTLYTVQVTELGIYVYK